MHAETAPEEPSLEEIFITKVLNVLPDSTKRKLLQKLTKPNKSVSYILNNDHVDLAFADKLAFVDELPDEVEMKILQEVVGNNERIEKVLKKEEALTKAEEARLITRLKLKSKFRALALKTLLTES